jgi:hypothetical protein
MRYDAEWVLESSLNHLIAAIVIIVVEIPE